MPVDAANLPLVRIVEHLRAALDAGADRIELVVVDPDCGSGGFAGARLDTVEGPGLHRPWSTWVELAGRLHLRVTTPVRVSETRVRIGFVRLNPRAGDRSTGVERYGTDSWFASVRKAEDPCYLLDVEDMLGRVGLPECPRILFLGVNQGDEIALVTRLLGRSIEAVGVDHSPTAIEAARQRGLDAQFFCIDLGQLGSLDIGTFDLVVAIDVLHSPAVDDAAVLHHVVQQRVRADGAVCIGVPNCVYLDGERLPGARTRNFTQPELSLLIKRVAFYRRYLHQHRFRVFVTGQHEVLVTGVR